MPTNLIWVTVALLLVLLRRPARRLFGAGPAFTLWMLPPVLAAMPLLPAMHTPWPLLPAELAHGVSALSAGQHIGSANHGGYWLAPGWPDAAALCPPTWSTPLADYCRHATDRACGCMMPAPPCCGRRAA